MSIGLEKTLSLSDLIFFGLSSILGSGGFNLIGNAIKDGGHYFPFALLASGALFTGSASSYSYAHDKFNKNISETLLVESIFGEVGKNTSIVTILAANIFSIATILVFCAKTIFPNATYTGQVSFSLLLLSMMMMLSLQRLEFNKTIINTFSVFIIILLSFISLLSFGAFEKKDAFVSPTFPKELKIYESFLFFFFILAGHDALMKFSEETTNKNDINRSFYISIFISIVLVCGVCISSIIWIKDFTQTQTNVNDIIENIFDTVLGHNVGNLIQYISLIFAPMIISP